MSCPDEKNFPKLRIAVKGKDIFRATLADDCGNLGYLGFAPDASTYHVVVPVDLKLARGVKALNQPDDGTPFGGYRGWHYYECRPYPREQGNDGRRRQIDSNAKLLTIWMSQFGMEVNVID